MNSTKKVQEHGADYMNGLSHHCKKLNKSETAQIAKGLKNECITTLIFEGCQLEIDQLKIVIKALMHNKSVTTLIFKDNKIGQQEAKEIADFLKFTETVCTLHFDHNEIGELGMNCLLKALKENQSVTNLSLKCNQMRDKGAQNIAGALKNIKKLYLSCNLIGDHGAKQIAESLKFNQSLAILDLSSNEIGNLGAKSIAEAIENNQSIIELHLHCNKIEEKGAKDIAMSVKKNTCIKKLTLHGNSISDTLLTDIEEYLKTNTMPAKKDVASSSRTDFCKADQTSELNGSYEQQIQQYVPNIPKVNLFTSCIKRSDDKNMDDIFLKISNLIHDGRDKLQEHSNKGILLLGDTGAGKSTLANLFSGKELQAVMDDETNDLVIDTVQLNENIVIGHKLASETRIPNKCTIGNVNIWDCPGFNDTDTVQEIVNMFYIKRLIENADSLKFVLVISELVLNTANARGTNFLETLSNFIKCFNDIEGMKGNIFLVVTHVPRNKTIKHIKSAIKYILTNNQDVTPKQKVLINKLKEDKSIYLFYKPRAAGDITEQNLLAPSNFLETILESSKCYAVEGNIVNKAISPKAKDCSLQFLNTASVNFVQILEVIITALCTPIRCTNKSLNPFLKNYNLIKKWMSTPVQYKDLPQHKKDDHLFECDLLLNMQEVLSGSSNNLSDSVKIFENAVEVFAEYVEPGNQHKVQDFVYCLQQQYELVDFFAKICDKELPNNTKIKEIIIICQNNIMENFQYHVMSLTVDKSQTDEEYYLKAIKYLEQYPDSQNCKEQKAIAYSCLGTIAEINGDEKLALDYYRKSIEANGHSPELCIKLGQLFFKEGQFAEAIDYYKVVNNDYKIIRMF